MNDPGPSDTNNPLEDDIVLLDNAAVLEKRVSKRANSLPVSDERVKIHRKAAFCFRAKQTSEAIPHGDSSDEDCVIIEELTTVKKSEKTPCQINADRDAALKRYRGIQEVRKADKIRMREIENMSADLFVKDPHLLENYFHRWKVNDSNPPNMKHRIKMIRALIERTGRKIRSLNLQSLEDNEIYWLSHSADYFPRPRSRFLITEDIAEGQHRLPIAMYSDIETDSTRVVLPPSFNYITENNANSLPPAYFDMYFKHREACEISCGCKEELDGRGCWQNEDCPCYKMNVKMRQLQRKAKSFNHPPTEFKTYDPCYVLESGDDDFNIKVGFACSSSCACSGNCANNVLRYATDPIFGLELYRRDKSLGFGVRTMTFIPNGSPVFEFVGELTSHSSCTIPTTWVPLAKVLKENLPPDIMHTYASGWYVDPKTSGNVARFVSHGCFPNLAFYRVYSKGLAPHQAHLVFFAMEDLPAGTELYFDYGPDYLKESGVIECLCNTLGCTRTATFEKLAKLDDESVKTLLEMRLHDKHRQRDWINDVLADADLSTDDEA
ncbi:unnamed protein product [Caenorhabditis auriculariae]|uniref:SET domain-containing protein n=1 Tax=Caenorhabditis auriculariae TaxID=2777116 RepID=A0A8S1GTX9_9PELO|nr:unnamed protein product [Caenorhabditis auriculariae]